MTQQRQWTLSWTVPSDPGTGGVYVEGPVLRSGESVTVTETEPRRERTTMRTRILVFLAALMGVAIWNPPSPWAVVIACGVYLVVVLPVVAR